MAYDPLAILIATLPEAYLQAFEQRHPENLLIKTARELRSVVPSAPRFVCFLHYLALLKLLDSRLIDSDKYLSQLHESIQGSGMQPRIRIHAAFLKAPEFSSYFSFALPKQGDKAFAYLVGNKILETRLYQDYSKKYFQAVKEEIETFVGPASSRAKGEGIERFLLGSGFSCFINGVRLSLVPVDERLSYARYVLAGPNVNLFKALERTRNLCMTAMPQLQTFLYEKKGILLTTLEDEGATAYQFDCEETGAPIRVTSSTYVHQADQVDNPLLTKVTACYEVYLPGQIVKEHDAIAKHIFEVKPMHLEDVHFKVRVFDPVIELVYKRKSELIAELEHQADAYDIAIAQIDSTLSASVPSPCI
jgi:hypothetical protein